MRVIVPTKRPKPVEARLVSAFGKPGEMKMTDRFTEGTYKGCPLVSVLVSDPFFIEKEIAEGRLTIPQRAEPFLQRELQDRTGNDDEIIQELIDRKG